MTPQFYVYFLQSLLTRAYSSLEWALNSPPKPHAFQALPLQSMPPFGGIDENMASLFDVIREADMFANIYSGILDAGLVSMYSEIVRPFP